MYTLGVPPEFRVNFQPPDPLGAPGRLGPRLLETMFKTHLRPFPQVLSTPVAFPVRIPRASRYMNPKNDRLPAGHPAQQQLPSVPTATACPPCAAAGVPAVEAPAASAPAVAPTSGAFGAAGLGMGPHIRSRGNTWGPYGQSLAGIKYGGTQAGNIVRLATNPAYRLQNVPAGTYPPW